MSETLESSTFHRFQGDFEGVGPFEPNVLTFLVLLSRPILKKLMSPLLCN